MESRSSPASETFSTELFHREDEGNDGLFYAEPRLSTIKMNTPSLP